MNVFTRRAFGSVSAGALLAIGHSSTGQAQGQSAIADSDDGPSPPLSQMIKAPILIRGLYQYGVGGDYDLDGASEANRRGYSAIGYQRQGAEWIVRGIAVNRKDWISLGWRMLDWGLAYQTLVGDFGGSEPFYSTGQYIEALARSCVLDPTNATKSRVDGLVRAARWHMQPDVELNGLPLVRPYTHRYYIFAAAFGQAAAATGQQVFTHRAEKWARDGLSMQLADGINPERGGFDVSYQMVGVLFAMRYLAVCENPSLRRALRTMTRSAVEWELKRQSADGRIDAVGSSRVNIEHLINGRTKKVNYSELMQAFVYAALAVPDQSWLKAGELISKFQSETDPRTDAK
ncbi:MAG: hypothetical protein Q8M24_11260 [Pseudolabrys sp.]|nr:hypothetical protein [Pseudolabrys sp.]